MVLKWLWGEQCKRNYFLSMVRVKVNPEISERGTGAIEQCELGWGCTPWPCVHLGKVKGHLPLHSFPSLFQYGILFQLMLQNKTPVHFNIPGLFYFPVSVYVLRPLFLQRTNGWKRYASEIFSSDPSRKERNGWWWWWLSQRLWKLVDSYASGRKIRHSMKKGHLQKVKVGAILVNEMALAEEVLPRELDEQKKPLGIIWWNQEVGDFVNLNQRVWENSQDAPFTPTFANISNILLRPWKMVSKGKRAPLEKYRW